MQSALYPNVHSLAGGRAVVTGASSGIGEAVARRLAEAGCGVALVARREERLAKLAAELKAEYNVPVEAFKCDCSDLEAIAALPERVQATELKDPTILIANAGLALGKTGADDNNMEDSKIMIDTNVTGVVALCRAFLPGMKERNDGHVLTTGSVAGLHAYAGGSVYCASKFAVNAFTQAMRHDLQDTALRIAHIAPGWVETEFSNGARVRPPASVCAAPAMRSSPAVRSAGRRATYPLLSLLHAHVTRAPPFVPTTDARPPVRLRRCPLPAVRFKGDDAKADALYKGFTPLYAHDVADSMMYVLTRPKHVQVADVVVYCTAQAHPTTVARNSKAP